eukprot:1224518-Lingulodinium_polyedra.AAC.1
MSAAPTPLRRISASWSCWGSQKNQVKPIGSTVKTGKTSPRSLKDSTQSGPSSAAAAASRGASPWDTHRGPAGCHT